MNRNFDGKPFEGKKCRRHIGKVILAVLAFALLKSVAVMLLWNALVPGLFHGPLLSFPQAIGLLVLAKLLFGGGFKGRGHFQAPWRRWDGITREDRQKMWEEFHRRREASMPGQDA